MSRSRTFWKLAKSWASTLSKSGSLSPELPTDQPPSCVLLRPKGKNQRPSSLKGNYHLRGSLQGRTQQHPLLLLIWIFCRNLLIHDMWQMRRQASHVCLQINCRQLNTPIARGNMWPSLLNDLRKPASRRKSHCLELTSPLEPQRTRSRSSRSDNSWMSSRWPSSIFIWLTNRWLRGTSTHHIDRYLNLV